MDCCGFVVQFVYLISIYNGTEWHDTKLHRGFMCTGLICFYSRRSPLRGPWRPRRPSHQISPCQPCILRCRSRGVEQSAVRHSICIDIVCFLKSAQNSFVSTVVLCTLIFNLIRAAYAVRRLCSDFIDMLRRPISCRFIIIIIF